MKKINYAMFVLALGVSVANAKPVKPLSAKTVAENFYKLNSPKTLEKSTLVHTGLSSTGEAVYYAYNINESDGFVIVAADDIVKPIIGYSTERSFVAPAPYTGINFWLNEFSNGLKSLRDQQGVIADAKAIQEWEKYSSNASNARLTGGVNSVMTGHAVAPLVQTLWNQSPYYNAYCPGSTGNGTNSAAAVTGCVATTMAQIMRYWGYPAQGTGSSSYTQSPNPNNYPMQSANYGATTYNWANMPITVTSTTYTDVAQLMYQAGVSVQMDYDPAGSGAQVLGSNPSAQYSYKTYFKYDPNLIRGFNRSGTFAVGTAGDIKWLDTIEHDLNLGRPVQYAGQDPSEGGHTWVCDGYDVNDNVHMNWGWAGSDDGYFSINNLLTSNGGFNPSTQHQILTGIVPIASHITDASVASISSPTGAYCVNTFTPSITLKNFGSNTLTVTTINYSIDGVAQTPINWSGNLADQQSIVVTLPAFTSSTNGTHTLTCATSAPNGTTDQNTANDQSVVMFNTGSVSQPAPIIEGFEGISLPSSIWGVSHTGTGLDWAVTPNAAATGANSAMINNMNNTGGTNSFLQTYSSYNLSAVTSPILTFKAAYQQKATTNADKLEVLTSTDCGATWAVRKTITSSVLASLAGGVGSAAYVPTTSQWTTYSVTISSVATSNNVMFRWEFLADANGPGNNLYVDDINIIAAASAGINNIETELNLSLYPNPSADKVNVEFNLTDKHTISVNVVDVLGRTVETIPAKSYESGETTLTIGNKATYQSGVYFVNIDMDGQHISKKIIMQ